MTANDSSSSATSLPEDPAALGLDLLGGGRLPSMPSAFLRGSDRDLLAPLQFLDAGELPGEPPRVDRSELARALATANAAYGHPAAERLADRLADPATRVVVTGQQPGLYGGPLYSLSKMVAAVLWAEAIEASGSPAVAVFWVATEDHDWSEVAQATFLARSGLLKVDLGEDPAPLLPVGMRTFGQQLEEVVRQLEGVELPSRWYRPNSRFGEAFSRLLVAARGERAPLVLDSMLPELKSLQQPWLRKLVDHRQEVERAQSAANAEIERRGHRLQVKPRPGFSPLFMLQGSERRRIAWTADGGYSLHGPEGASQPLEQLEQILDENPSVISPGVLARPAIQDAVLGTSLQVMGPAEISYLPQVAAIYPVLGIQAPWTTLRPQALVLEERQAGYLKELDVSLAELFDTELDHLVTEKLGEDLVGPVRQRIDELLEGLGEPLMALDRGLEGPLRKTRAHIDRGLDQLGGKVAGAVGRRHDVWRRRLDQVRTSCLPDGKGQERLLCVAHFLDRYGPGFVDTFSSQLGLDARRLHVVRISPAPSGGVSVSGAPTGGGAPTAGGAQTAGGA